MDKKVSVIVPIYNAEMYIERCVQALLHQTYANMEIILVDDGSTDTSASICEKLQGDYSNIRIFRKTNGGVSSARNLGIKMATGDYIGFVDCDDTPKPEMYETLVEAISNADFALGGYEKVGIYARENVHLPFHALLSGEEIQKIAYSMAFWNGYFQNEALKTIYGSVWPNLYIKEILCKNGIFFPENITLGEDLLFNLRYLGAIQKAKCVDKPLYEYTTANPSATRKRNNHLWEQYCLLIGEVEKTLKESFEDNEEFTYNVNRQYINFAIGVVEEQFGPFFEGKKLTDEIKNLCQDPKLESATGYVMHHARNRKEWIQAMLFRLKMAKAIKAWLLR